MVIPLVKPDKSRYVYLYLPSKADKERWEKLAEQAKAPLSKFIIEIVENSLTEEENFKPRREVMKELEAIKKENKTLRDDLKQKIIVLEKYETDLKRYRSQSFQDAQFEGVRRFSREIIEILKSRGHIDSNDLLDSLGVDPKESELVKALSSQLEELEGYALIEPTSRGWRWKE